MMDWRGEKEGRRLLCSHSGYAAARCLPSAVASSGGRHSGFSGSYTLSEPGSQLISLCTSMSISKVHVRYLNGASTNCSVSLRL